MKPHKMILNAIDKCQTLEDLEKLLSAMLSEILDVWPDGSVSYGRKRVEVLGSLRIEIRSNEHAPPHFHVIGPTCDASFRLSDCHLLKGTAGSREVKIIKLWFEGAKHRLVEIWDETRPSKCPVGRVRK